MTKDEARAYIAESARKYGVDPAIALSVWEQESGQSLDLGLKGETIQRGKWKGSYARGPWQIMSFHGDLPDDFEGQTDWAMRHLAERGVRGYYGEGTPGVPGHPTTSQYEEQVLARAGQVPPSLSTPPIGAQEAPGAPPMPGTLPPDLSMAQALPGGLPAASPTLSQRLGMNPWVQMGLGVLGSPSPGGNWMMGSAQGASQGLQQAQAAQAAQAAQEQQALQQQLWLQQLAQQERRMRGDVPLTPQQQAQIAYQQGQLVNKTRELDLRESGKYAPQAESSGPRPPTGYQLTQEGALAPLPGGPADPATVAGLARARKGETKAAETAGAGTSGDFGGLIAEAEQLATQIRAQESGISPLGTVGDWGAKLSAGAGIVDQVLGTGLSSTVARQFGGMDPKLVRSKLQAVTLPIARILVDPKGPLAQSEQDQAKRLLGLLEGEGLISGDQALNLLEQTLALARSAQSGSPPPVMGEMEAPPSAATRLIYDPRSKTLVPAP